MEPKIKEDVAAATLVERPPDRAHFLDVRICSTPRGLSIEGLLSLHDAAGRKVRGPRVTDRYAQTRPLSYTELLAFLAWWATARCEMLPEIPVISPGLPVGPGAVAAKQPGSLPGEGKGRGERVTRKR